MIIVLFVLRLFNLFELWNHYFLNKKIKFEFSLGLNFPGVYFWHSKFKFLERLVVIFGLVSSLQGVSKKICSGDLSNRLGPLSSHTFDQLGTIRAKSAALLA
jgi:hypothetical protein